MMPSRPVMLVALCCLAAPASAQQPAAHHQGTAPAMSEARKQALVKDALAAAPAHIAKNATVVAPGADGKMVELKHGTNGWTCLPDAPDTPGKDPMCLDEQAMKWATSWMNHEPKPANTAPGLGYMLQGGSDISAKDPWAKPDKNTKFVSSPPHYMILWPFDPQASGLSDQPKKTGTWVMWAGTPYAHLMINQAP
jgi:hypothetical protein